MCLIIFFLKVILFFYLNKKKVEKCLTLKNPVFSRFQKTVKFDPRIYFISILDENAQDSLYLGGTTPYCKRFVHLLQCIYQ